MMTAMPLVDADTLHRVLVVDDDPAVLESLIDELSESYHVTSATSGEAAVELLQRERFDAIISDVRMPGIDGVEVVRQAQSVDCNMVRILLTGYSDEAAVEAAWMPGGVYKLGKPWGEELEIVLRRAFEQRQRIFETQRELATTEEARAQAERVAFRLNKMAAIGTLMAGVAHELRSPLTYLSANFDWLQEKTARISDAVSSLVPDDGDRPRERLDAEELLGEFRTICTECTVGLQRMHELIEGLRVYSSARRPRNDPIDITHCVARATKMVLCEFKRHVVIDSHVEEKVGWVCGHEGEITQILINLLVNAIQAMGGRGKVTLSVRPAEQAVEVRVEDHGPGVPDELRERLFEPFFTTKDEKGSGLGLAISRDIARKHRGDLWCDPASAGAVFILRLPLFVG